MLFIPNDSKYKKQQKGKSFCRVNKNINFFQLKHGSIGLKALSFGRVASKEIKTANQIMNKILKKRGFIKINIFPQTPISKKPLEIRMGKGKGNVHHWSCKIKAGTTLCEIQTSSITSGIKALKAVQSRLPFKTSIILN